MTGGNNPATDRSKPDAKRRFDRQKRHSHISGHNSGKHYNIKAVTDVVDNAVVQQAAAADNACHYCKKRQ
jgi:hypothetical protein